MTIVIKGEVRGCLNSGVRYLVHRGVYGGAANRCDRIVLSGYSTVL